MNRPADTNRPQLKCLIGNLAETDFELAYLAALTQQGLKPLSRWEKPLDSDSRLLLNQMNLKTKEVSRTVHTGRRICETIFSLHDDLIEIYHRRFAEKPLDKSAPTIRFEGFLFGFPPCCVRAYIKKPYAENNLASEDQKTLFHWACKDCDITPLLLPAYRRIRRLVESC